MRELLVVLLLTSACGRLAPGAITRPAKTVDYTFSRSSGSASSKSRYSSDKPVYDDKGCANMTGEGGAKIQAACRSGR
jgi:hypothetical protein